MEEALWVHAHCNPGKKLLARGIVGPTYRPNVLIINGSYLVIKQIWQAWDLAALG